MKTRFFAAVVVAVLSLAGGAGSAAYAPAAVGPVGQTVLVVPEPVGPEALSSTDIIAIATGRDHTCVLMEGGGVKCWGQNNNGQLGDGTTINRNLPVDVSGLSSGVMALVAGGRHTCALTMGDGVKCWGWNELGQLGDGTTVDRHTPVAVTGLADDVTAISAGGGHSCAVSDGAAKCWGGNQFGQLGDGTTTSRSTPVDVSGLASGVTALSAGGEHTCALMLGGGVKCWGYNFHGELGAVTGTYYSTVPVDVQDLDGPAEALVAGYAHSCARMSDGGAKCWGGNSWGQLGDGTTTSRSAPAYVSGLSSDVAALAAGEEHTCAVTTTGEVKCWGWNLYGQLGDGTTTLRLTPVGVTGLAIGAAMPAAGDGHSCALMVSAGAQCWGHNTSGQLGDWTRTDRLTPVTVRFPAATCLLPLILRDYCPNFHDDFSNPASGWFVADEDWVRAQYLNGEYRILIKQVDYYGVFSAPTCDRENYQAEVVARWAGNSGTGYGLIFGIVGGFQRFYLFLVNTDYQEYLLLRYDGAGVWTYLSSWNYSPTINTGASSNEVGVIRDGSTIRLIINGSQVGTFSDATIAGKTGAGVAVASYLDLPNADARFDDFRMTAYSSTLSTTTTEGDMEACPSPSLGDDAFGALIPENLHRRLHGHEGE